MRTPVHRCNWRIMLRGFRRCIDCGKLGRIDDERRGAIYAR